MAPALKVYVLHTYHRDAIALLQSYSHIEAILPEDPRKATWHDDADGLIIRSDSKIGEDDFAKAKRLRVVVKQGVGVDNIDLVAAKKYGIAIHNTPALNSESVAEMSMAITLSLSRRISEIDRAVRRGETVLRNETLATSMFRKTVGVVGMGNIGRMIAQKWVGAFECSIVGYDPVAPLDAWADLNHYRAKTLNELLKISDVVTLHVPLLPTTRGMIGENEFNIMKPSAFLINCSRGGVVDESALLAALSKKKIGGAGLDVMEIEPPTLKAHGEFLKYENVILTPHAGGSTIENQSNSGKRVVEILVQVLAGEEAAGKLV